MAEPLKLTVGTHSEKLGPLAQADLERVLGTYGTLASALNTLLAHEDAIAAGALVPLNDKSRDMVRNRRGGVDAALAALSVHEQPGPLLWQIQDAQRILQKLQNRLEAAPDA